MDFNFEDIFNISGFDWVSNIMLLGLSNQIVRLSQASVELNRSSKWREEKKSRAVTTVLTVAWFRWWILGINAFVCMIWDGLLLELSIVNQSSSWSSLQLLDLDVRHQFILHILGLLLIQGLEQTGNFADSGPVFFSELSGYFQHSFLMVLEELAFFFLHHILKWWILFGGDCVFNLLLVEVGGYGFFFLCEGINSSLSEMVECSFCCSD